MSTMGEMVLDGRPSAAQAGVLPVYDANPDFSRFDRPWGALANKLGAEGFVPITVAPAGCAAESGLCDDMAAADSELSTGAAIAESAPADNRRECLLGGVAIEAAGITRADQMEGEERTRERYHRFLGGVAMHASRPQAEAPKTVHASSLDLLRNAADGDQESEQALLLDAKTHVYEIIGGIGERIEVKLQVNGKGEVVWVGQTTEARQFHSLITYKGQSPQMTAIQHAEGLGSFRLEDRNREGQLKGLAVFDFSAMARASHAELSEMGYFLNSIGVCIRRNSFAGGECTVTSVFAAGVDQRKFKPVPEETEAQEVERQKAALKDRFDIKVLRRMYKLFKVKGAESMEPDQLLATQIVGPDSLDEIDMLMLYDHFAAEEMDDGSLAFFGSAELWAEIGSPSKITREHYMEHIARREQRQAEYDQLCRDVVKAQIAQAYKVNTPAEAVDMKRRVALDVVAGRAAHDHKIDETRLGRKSAKHVREARQCYSSGDVAGGDRLKRLAQQEAIDPSCPPGLRKKNRNGDPANDLMNPFEEDLKSDADENCGGEIKDGQEVHCPYCDKDVKANVPPDEGGRVYCSNPDCEAFKKDNNDSGANHEDGDQEPKTISAVIKQIIEGLSE